MAKRRIKLINPGVQLRMCLTFLAVAMFCITLQFALHQIAVADAGLNYPEDPVAMATYLHGKVWDHLLVSVWILLPMTIAVGVIATFRIAGPIYHLEQHLRAVARGEDPGTLFFRTHDEFRELPQVVNAALDRLRSEGAGGRFQDSAPCAESAGSPGESNSECASARSSASTR